MVKGPRIVVDARWLLGGGAGGGAERATELLVRGLQQAHMDAEWILWGPDHLSDFLWEGATLARDNRAPGALMRQRGSFSMPESDITLFMHQERPLRRVHSVTMMYDTIRVRQASGPVSRALARTFLKWVAAVSEEIVTCTHYSEECLYRDVGIGSTPVTVASWPVDRELVRRVLAARKSSARRDVAIYVGRYKSHKNVNRMVAAFCETEFGRSGGRLVLLGGTEAERQQLESILTVRQRKLIEVRGQCSQEELDEHLANSLFLVQPSLDEGFGLPVWEAMSCGLPVCVSDGGSLPEITMGRVKPFSATSIPEMTEAIDDCAASARGVSIADMRLSSQEFGRRAPTVAGFAEQFQTVLRRHL